MLTGALDLAIYSKHGFVSGDENGLVRSTQCAHIMPESTNNFQYVGDKEGQASTIQVMLASVCFTNI